MLYQNTPVSQAPPTSKHSVRKGASKLLPILAFGVVALTLLAGVASATSCDDYKQIYAKTHRNDDNHKKVDLYCSYDWKAISCEAAIGAADSYHDASDRAIALNEIFPRQFGSGHDERWGCRGQANNIFGYFGHEYRFDWELKVFATCVPKHCVDRYEAHHGDFDADTKSGGLKRVAESDTGLVKRPPSSGIMTALKRG